VARENGWVGIPGGMAEHHCWADEGDSVECCKWNNCWKSLHGGRTDYTHTQIHTDSQLLSC